MSQPKWTSYTTARASYFFRIQKFFLTSPTSCIYGDLAGNIKAIVASCVLRCQTLALSLTALSLLYF